MQINSELKSLVLAFGAYFMFYYNRKSVTLVFPQLIAEGLSQQNAGTIVSAQSMSMAMVTFGAGILSDRIAAKHLLCVGLFVAGMSTLLFPLATTVTQYSILWFVNGFGQGFSLPSILKLTRDNSHATRFATNWSVVLISVNIAGVLNPFISAFITQTYGWRTALVVSGTVTLTVCFICCALLDTRRRSDDKGVDRSEKTPMNHKRNSTQSEDNKLWKELLKSPTLWMCIICRFIVALSRISVTDWSQLYLIHEQHMDVYHASTFVSAIEIGGIFGKLIAGRISDALLVRALRRHAINNNNSTYNVKLMARLPVSIAMLAFNALALHLYCFYITANSSLPLLLITALLLGVNTSGNVVNLSVIATEISAERAGLCTSLVNLSAKVGGIFTGLPLSLIANYYSWNFAFILIEILCIFCVILQNILPRLSTRIKQD